MSQSVPPASLEIRDAVFQELIRISPASNYMKELVAGPAGLLSRGLLEDDATRYGALPRTKQERAVLTGILNDYVRAHFPCCCFGVVRYVVRLSLLTMVFAELGNLYEGQKCKPK